MVLKTFTLEWHGAKEEITYEDDIPFGDMEVIIKKCVNLEDITKPKVNISEYRRRILSSVLRKAPFTHTDPIAISKLPRKTAEIIIAEVMKDYPLAGCLEGWMTSFLGSAVITDSLPTATPSVQASSDSTKKPQTDNRENGSKEQSLQQGNNSKTQSK